MMRQNYIHQTKFKSVRKAIGVYLISSFLVYALFSSAWADLSPCIPLRGISNGYLNERMPEVYYKFDREGSIVYLSSTERAQHLLKIKDGKALDYQDGRWIPWSSGDRIYVMNDQGSFYTLNVSDYNRRVKHSTFFGGGDVAAAGKISFENGRLSHIDNGSGHYKPSEFHLKQALAQLVKQGVDISRATLGFGGNSTVATPASVIEPVSFLFNKRSSRECIERAIRLNPEKSATELRIFQASDQKRFNRFLLDLEMRRELEAYEPALRMILEESPYLKRELPEKVVKRFDPDFVQTRHLSCIQIFLQRIFTN